MEVDSLETSCDASRRVDEQCHRATLQEALQTIETFVRGENWPARIQDAWAKVRRAVIKGGALETRRTDDATMAITELKAQVKDIAEAVRGLTKTTRATAPLSYAAVLQRGATQPREMPVPARRSREVTIAPGKETTVQRQRSGQEIVRDINASIECEAAIAARRLQSGDTLLTFETEEARRKWEKDPKVIKTFGTDARIRIKEYTVLAHGVRVPIVNPQDQQAAIKAIYAQNPRLQGKVTIIRVGWAYKTLKHHKKIGPLHIGLAEPEQANLLIDQGLLLGSELHDCEVFYGDCQVTQCYKCHSYGHTAKHCKNMVRCGHCAAIGHKANECPKKDERIAQRCIACKGKHPSWARECPVRRKHAEAARQAYTNRPIRFQVRTKLAEAIAATSAITSNQAPGVNTDFSLSQEPPVFNGTPADSDIEVEAPRPKRRRGRPFAYETLQQSQTRSQDIRTIFQLSQNE